MKDDILAALPQTQCEECGYNGCAPYAQAILEGEDIDLCAPGGMKVLERLEKITNRVGDQDKTKERYIPPTIAYINQNICIGCMKCIPPCPTGAIVGAKKQNHYVIETECTGCSLCVKACPIDCIIMKEDTLSLEKRLELSDDFRELFEKNKVKVEEEGLKKKTSNELKEALKALRDTNEPV